MEPALVWDGVEVAALYVSEGRQVGRTGCGVTHLVSPPLSQTVLSSVLWSVGIVRDDISAQSVSNCFQVLPSFHFISRSLWVDWSITQISRHTRDSLLKYDQNWRLLLAKQKMWRLKWRLKWRVKRGGEWHSLLILPRWTTFKQTSSQHLLSKMPPITCLRNCDAAFKTEPVNKSK